MGTGSLLRSNALGIQTHILELKKRNFPTSQTKDSYCYTEPTSWLFDYKRKKALLAQTFQQTLYIDYDPNDMVNTFMQAIGYAPTNTPTERLNITL